VNSLIKANLVEAQSALEALLSNEAALESIQQAGEALVESFKRGGRVFSCGNGGSMCDAMHFAEELSGRFREDRPALGATAMSDPGHMNCVANDYGYEYVFSRYLEAHAREGDLLLGISTSGTSKNILKAVETAKARGVVVVSLTGKPNSAIGQLDDIDICTPGGRYADRVQELHIKVIHTLIDFTEQGMFSS
jgi:D-sedoheptulose 7-phosphate isomerase